MCGGGGEAQPSQQPLKGRQDLRAELGMEEGGGGGGGGKEGGGRRGEGGGVGRGKRRREENCSRVHLIKATP